MPEVQEPGTCSLLDADVAPHWPAKPGVYVRGAFTRQMGAQQLARMTGGTRCGSGATRLACAESEACLMLVLSVPEWCLRQSRFAIMSGLHVICNQGKGAIRTSAVGGSLQSIPLQSLACQAPYQHACNAPILESGHERLSSQCCSASVRHICCRAQKSVETALAGLGMSSTPDMSTRETCGAWLALRRETIDLNDLKRRVQVRADGAGSVGPEGRGKRTHKGKVTPQAPLCPP